MKLQIETGQIAALETDALAVICFESEPGKPVNDAELASQKGWLASLRESREFTGKLFDIAMLHKPEGLAAKRLVVIGGGKAENFTSVEARRIAGVLSRSLKPKFVHSIALWCGKSHSSQEYASAFAEGAILGDFEPDKYKSDPNKADLHIDRFILASPGAGPQFSAAADHGRIIAEAQNFTRDLVNEPANVLTPSLLAESAQKLSAEHSLECKVLNQAEMEQLGMGALLGVARGSQEPPHLIVIRYTPAKAVSPDHLALVGKAVTFDTGGVSIKPSDGMEKMKYDMAGGAAVLGAMKAIAQLKPSVAVTAYIPAVENMVSGNAQRPGDIVKSLSGKTIEVLNTDAEGRLILADAITYAKQQGATHIVDAATLTGAIVVALGHYHIGAFTNDQSFLDRVLSAGRVTGEKAWQLPLDEEYKDYLKSAFADLPNIGGRWGGSITAAWFLREFADPSPWVHLDIAGTAWLDDAKPYLAKGPSGIGVRTFVELALSWTTLGAVQ